MHIYSYVQRLAWKLFILPANTRAMKGVKNKPEEDYHEPLVLDHDKMFYSYGTGHQECLAHILRYFKDSMDNEPERT